MEPQKEIKELLESEFARLRAKNSRYSLRSFAKKLDVSPSALSEIFRGKRPLTAKNAARILNQLAVEPAKIEKILKSFRKDEAKAAFTTLDMDHFKVISDWYYFAILSLAETKTFSEDPKEIGRRLNIPSSQATAALRALERLGMLIRDRANKLVPSGIQYTTSNDILDAAIQRQHFQALELAGEALNEFGVQQRDFSALTMAIDPDLLPEAKRRIKKFRAELCGFLESGEKKEVFRFCVQLFPLSRSTDS